MVNDDRWMNEWERRRFRLEGGRSREGDVQERGRGPSGRRDFGRSGRDFGPERGMERHARVYSGRESRGEGPMRREAAYGGNDYSQGFYGADQGYPAPRGSDRDSSGRRGERSGWDRFGDELSSWFGGEDAERRRERDMGDAGHRGRGPRNYSRSDDRIREDVNDRLTDDPHVDASEIEVAVSNREVTLTGTVSTRFEKRHAEDLAESVSGVTHVQNNLRVQQQAGSGPGGQSEHVVGGITGTSATGPQGTGLGGVEVGPSTSEEGTRRSNRRKTGAGT